jgi:hypothetical protein
MSEGMRAMKVEDVGFFRELPHGDPGGPSLREAIGRGDAQFRNDLASYLASGAVLASTAQRVDDVLSNEKLDAGQLAIQTDGRWTWPADLAYYVRKYNVQLPSTFVEQAQASAWKSPDLSPKDLYEIEIHLFPDRATTPE